MTSEGAARRAAGRQDVVTPGIASINSSLEMLLRLHASRRVVELQGALVHRKISQPGLSLLRRLLTAGPLSMGELARSARMDSGAAARQIATLEAEGAVRRTPCESDGRITVVSLTADGEDLVRALVALQQKHMLDALGDWADEEIEQFAASLERFVISLRRTDFRPPFPAGSDATQTRLKAADAGDVTPL